MATRTSTEVDGLTIAYMDRGSGPAIVMLHGLGTSADMWTHQLEALRSTYRVVCPDLRGFGLSAKPADESRYSIERYADDVISLLDHLGIERCSLVGTSMGGYVALMVASLVPERLDRLVLAHTACSRQVPPDLLRERVEALSRSATMADYAAVVVEQALHSSAGAAVRRSLRRLIGANDMATYRIILSSGALDFDLCSIVAPLVPSLIVTSDDDRVVPSSRSWQLARLIPGTQLAVVHESGHLSALEQPAAVNDLLTQFLRTGGLVAPAAGAGWHLGDPFT